MKKIGLLISTLNAGGAERVVSRLSKILSSDYEIYLILFEDTYIKYEYAGTLVNLDVKSSKNFFKQLISPIMRIKKLKQIKKDIGLDMVISFLDSPNIVNVLAKSAKCKTIISIRNYTEIDKKQNMKVNILNFIIGKLYKKADKIIAVSKLIKDNVVEKYKIDYEKVEVIYNPYDIDEITELSQEKIEIENREFMKSDKILISVGRQMYQKGYWHLIKAFSLVKVSHPDVKLVFVGREEQKEQIVNLIRMLNLQNDVLIVGHNSNPFKYIKKSYAYILTSLFEGFPNALVEAMACACPVIASDCKSGPREILDEKQDIHKKIEQPEYASYGILVPELSMKEDWNNKSCDNTERKLAEAIIKLLDDKEIYNEYKRKSIMRAKEFSFEECRIKYQNLIETIEE